MEWNIHKIKNILHDTSPNVELDTSKDLLDDLENIRIIIN